MDNKGLVIVTFFYASVVLVTSWTSDPDVLDMASTDEQGGEFCSRETFTADCGVDHVVRMTQALIGRMELGKCADSEENPGCQVNALPFLHEKCSGKRECEVDVTDVDKHLANETSFRCDSAYVLYLVAYYTCIPVTTQPTKSCLRNPGYIEATPRPVNVSASHGFLSSVITRETNKGSSECPWRIQGEPGQAVQITLINFNSKVSAADGLCHVYAKIHERALPSTESRLMDCGYDSPQGKTFTSLTESVDVVIMEPSADPNFIIEFKVMGCPDVNNVTGGKIHRTGNRTNITCDGVTWSLVCREGQWTGWEAHTGECTTAAGTSQSGQWPKALGQELTIVLIISVAVVIAVAIVVVGVCIVRRRNAHDFQPVSQGVGEYGVYGLQGPVMPTKCYYPTLPLPPGSHCQSAGSDSSHYTTTIQRRQAVPPGSITPSFDTFPNGSPHLLRQQDVTSCHSCPVHSCQGGVYPVGNYHDRVGASGWQTFPIRRPDHIYESPKLKRKATGYDAPYYHELDPAEVERQLLEQQHPHVRPDLTKTAAVPPPPPPPPVTPIPQEDEEEEQSTSNDSGCAKTFPPLPPLPPDNKR